MLLIYPGMTETAEKKEARDIKPVDWPFMEQSEKVLSDLPTTWKAYPNTEPGMVGIIDMEYAEFKKMESREDKMHELVHLASACLHYWRHLNGAK